MGSADLDLPIDLLVTVLSQYAVAYYPLKRAGCRQIYLEDVAEQFNQRVSRTRTSDLRPFGNTEAIKTMIPSHTLFAILMSTFGRALSSYTKVVTVNHFLRP